MKKITMSVAALTIAISGFCNPPIDNKLVKEIVWTTENLIDRVKEDEFNGRTMTKELASIYVEYLLNIVSKAEDLQVIDCENCDEID
tara:strand:- start:146 stop:406 length:261 start_codon:yes stop_codon:yes gene_type:complete